MQIKFTITPLNSLTVNQPVWDIALMVFYLFHCVVCSYQMSLRSLSGLQQKHVIQELLRLESFKQKKPNLFLPHDQNQHLVESYDIEEEENN